MARRHDSVTSGSNLLEVDEMSSASSSNMSNSTYNSSSSYSSASYHSVRRVLQRSSAIIIDTVSAERDFGAGIKCCLSLAVLLSIFSITASAYVTWVKVVTARPICIQCDGEANIANEFCCENLQSILQKIIEEHNYNSINLPSTGIEIRRPHHVVDAKIGTVREKKSTNIIPEIGKRLSVRTLYGTSSMTNKATVGNTFVNITKTGKYLIVSYFDFSPVSKTQTWDTYGHTVRRYNRFLPNDNTELLLGGFYTVCVSCNSSEFDKKQKSYLSGIFLLQEGDKVYVSVSKAKFKTDKNYLSVISIENRTSIIT